MSPVIISAEAANGQKLRRPKCSENANKKIAKGIEYVIHFRVSSSATGRKTELVTVTSKNSLLKKRKHTKLDAKKDRKQIDIAKM